MKIVTEFTRYFDTVTKTIYKEMKDSVYYINSEGKWCGVGDQRLWLKNCPGVVEYTSANENSRFYDGELIEALLPYRDKGINFTPDQIIK